MLKCIPTYYRRFIMLKRHLLLASLLAGTFAVTACSQQTEDQAEVAATETAEAADSAGDDIAANTDAAATEAEIAAQNAGENIAQGAENAGVAANNAGEAIADGTNTAVANTAGVVADGANSVADGASNVEADAEAKAPTEQQY